MNKIYALIFLHVWFIVWLLFCLWYIRGNGAKKSYKARMKWGLALMPGKLKNKEHYIELTKRFAKFALVFGIFAYIFVLLYFIMQGGPF